MTQPPVPWQEDKRTAIIVNPAAHNAIKPKQRDQVDEWLNEAGFAANWLETGKAGEATLLARGEAEKKTPLLLVCGGDGTLNEAVNGLVGSETTLGVIPAGTVNLWARELRIKRKNPLAAVQQALEGKRMRIDLGRVGSRHFLCMAGYGIDAAVAAGVSRRLKGFLGAAAYAISSLREVLRFRGVQMAIDLDDETLKLYALMVIASNTREYAGITQITPEAVVDDGLLDVRIFEGKGRLAIATHALRVLLRMHRRSGRVHYRRVRRLAFDWDKPLPLQIDGDYTAEAAVEVGVTHDAMWAAVPRDLKTHLFSRLPDR
jgi:YegS/Rv2252/BmrU family lipid kinase